MGAAPYSMHGRRRLMVKRRRGVVDVAITLYADRGITRTSYDAIARLAGVSRPTVSNYFPSKADLFSASSARILAGAPPLGPEGFASITDLEDRLHALTLALDAYYRYLGPWFRWWWHEAILLPEIAAQLERLEENRRELLRSALAPEFGPLRSERLLTLCDVLLDFRTWDRLATNGNPDVESTLVQALMALVRSAAQIAPLPHTGANPTPKRQRLDAEYPSV